MCFHRLPSPAACRPPRRALPYGAGKRTSRFISCPEPPWVTKNPLLGQWHPVCEPPWGWVIPGGAGTPVPWQWFGWRMERFAPAPSASLGAPRWQHGRRCWAGFSPGSGEVRVACALLPPPQIPVGSRSCTWWGRLHQMFLPNYGGGRKGWDLKIENKQKETSR